MDRIDLIHFQTWSKLSDDAWSRLLSTRRFFCKAAKERQLYHQDLERLRHNIEWSPTFIPQVREFMWKSSETNTRTTRLFVEFSAKLINRVAFFTYLESLLAEFHYDVNSADFREEAKAHMQGDVASNFHSRICGSLEYAIPDVRVSVDERLASLVHANEYDSHRLFDRLMLGAVLSASEKTPVNLDFFWDSRRRAILIHNEDGQLASVVRDTIHAPHRQPEVLRSIPDLAMRIAPPTLPWEFSRLIVRGTTIFLPVQLANCRM